MEHHSDERLSITYNTDEILSQSIHRLPSMAFEDCTEIPPICSTADWIHSYLQDTCEDALKRNRLHHLYQWEYSKGRDISMTLYSMDGPRLRLPGRNLNTFRSLKAYISQ